MTQCLSEAEILGYVRSAINPQQRELFDEHVSSCADCKARVELARESSINLNAASAHQVVTQVEVSASEKGACSSSESHWTDGASQAVAASQAAAPKVSLNDFLTGLSQSGLLPPADLAAVRDRSHNNPATSTLSGLIEWLVKEHKLTRYQANILARGQSAGLVLGNYVILDKLGQGGMGTVFKARHRRMNRLVALKVLPQSLSSVPEAIARFQREVEAAARLQHPNIAAAFDADDANGVHFLVMEYVEGPTLANYIKQRGALPIAIAVKLAAQAARGLAAAHAQGIVHRDIKPSNIMINRQGIVKVLDMGLAQVRSSESNLDLTSDVTQTGRVMGTVDYMSPEQARDAKNVDLRADIYSLGCTLFFLATGKPPAPGNSAAEKLLWHQAQSPLALSATGVPSSPRLDELVLRMMAKQAEDRPRSMHDVADELDRCVADLPAADSNMLLDGMDLVSEHGASTLYGSNYGQATMHNLGDTVVSDAGSSSVQGPAEWLNTRRLMYLTGIAAAVALAVAVAGTPFWLNFGNNTPPPAAEGKLIITVEGEPADVLVDREMRGMTTSGAPLELKVKPGSVLVQVRRPGYEPYERAVAVRADEPARLAPVLSKIKVATQSQPSIHAGYEKLLNWVFSNGGQVTAVSGVGQRHQLNAKSVWPDVPLEIQAIKLDDTGVRDADLSILKEASGLLDLSLADTKITDAAIGHMKSLRELKRLNLSNTRITDDCMEQVASYFPSLSELNLERTAVGNGGIGKIKGKPTLEKLFLSDTKVTDAGLVHLGRLPALKILTAHGTGMSEPTHAQLEADLPELRISWDGADVERAVALKLLAKKATLTVLDRQGNKQAGITTVEKLPGGRILIKEANLSTGTDFKDDDLKQMSLLSEIESISLAGTQVKKEGLLSLQSMGKLRQLDLGTLNVDPNAVSQLKQLLPNCNIVIRDPADVEFARRVLNMGGHVGVQPAEGGKFSEVSTLAQLPNSFALRLVKLDGVTAVNDVFLEKLTELPQLQELYLNNTAVTDKCLERIAVCKSLKILSLSGTKVSPEGLLALKGLKLEQLYLASTEIGGDGVRCACELETLNHLSLQAVKLADNDLGVLKRLVSLRWLDLSGTPLTDGALLHLSGLKQLTDLNVQGTGLSDAGLEELKDDLEPGCKVLGDRPDPQRLAARWLVDHAATVSLATPPAYETAILASAKELPRDACRVLAIDVADLPIQQPKELAKYLAVCQNVVSLNLSQTGTIPAAASLPKLTESDLVFLRTMPSLRDLRLMGLGLSDQTLALLSGHAALEVLDLSGNKRITGRGLGNLHAATGLKQLLLANTSIEEQHLAALEKLAGLEALDLSAAPNLSDKCTDTIAKLKGLKMLGLRGAKVGDASAEKLASLAELERLDLDSTKITDGGVTKLVGLTKLNYIGLGNTAVTDSVVDSLAQMKQLATINLARTKVSPESIQRLRDALPGRSITAPAAIPRDLNPVGNADDQLESDVRVGRAP